MRTIAAARQKEINASMAVVATRTFTTGREVPPEDGMPVDLNAIRSRDAGQDYMLKSPEKESTTNGLH